MQNLTVEAPLEIVRKPNGWMIRDSRKRELWARITRKCLEGSTSGSETGSSPSQFTGFCSGSGPGFSSGVCKSCAYEWVEVREDGDCGTKEQAAHGTWCSFPAFEISGRDDVEVGTIVRLIPSRHGPWYVFTPGGSGGATGTGFEFAYILDDSPEDRDDLNQVYWNATIPQWDNALQDWENPDDAQHVWVVTRINEPLNKGAIVICRRVGDFDPTEGGSDNRPVYAGIQYRQTDVLVVQDNTPVEADGNLYWPAKAQYWDNDTQERKEGREVWLIDWLQDPKAFREGDRIIAHWIGDAQPGNWVDTFTGSSGSGFGPGTGSGSTQPDKKRPLYTTFASGINTKFLRCFENQVLARNGTITLSGGRISFLDEDCIEATEFEGICTG